MRIVEQYMSREPATIGKDEPLVAAHKLMQTHRIRHLPVLHQGRIVGVVSERDLYLLETLKNVDPRREPVEEAIPNAGTRLFVRDDAGALREVGGDAVVPSPCSVHRPSG